MTEEKEESFEMALHNLRHDAEEIAEVVSKARIIAGVSFWVILCALIGVTYYPNHYFFVEEKPLICIAIIAFDLFLAFVAYVIVGKKIVGFNRPFVQLTMLHTKWKEACAILSDVEDRQIEHKVFDKDVEKAEDGLILACEKLIESYNKS